MSMSRSDDSDDVVRRRSGWLIPLAVLGVIVVLSALFLLYYLAPTAPPLFTEQVSPPSSTDIAELEVGTMKFWIPANYLQYESARRGGHKRKVDLFAMLPDLTGWSNWNAGSFSDNGPNARIVSLSIYEPKVNLGEAERLKRVYLISVTDPKGEDGPYGLRKYTFTEGSGYHDQDLFVGDTPSGVVLLLCERLVANNATPKCSREMPLKGGVGASYHFKRARLSNWREIGDNVAALLATFEKPPK
jgi:hypothetical protein